MWPFQLFARGAVSAAIAFVATTAIVLRGEPESAISRLYSDFFPAVIAIVSVLIAAMAVLGGLLPLRQGASTAKPFKQTLASFRWTIEYATLLCVSLIVGRNIRLTPDGWIEPAIFLAIFGFVFLLTLVTGLARAVSDALER